MAVVASDILGGAGPAGWAAALGAGLLIGLERERRKGSGPAREAAGIRSFTLCALTGALCQALAEQLALPALVLLGALAVGALATAAYLRSAPRDPGLTTELALFTTYLVGVLCAVAPAQGAAAGVVVALLLAARSRLHRFATRVLNEHELHDGLLLAALVLVALPLVPPGPQAGWWGLDLRRLVGLSVLILALQAAGHVAWRLFGARAGLLLSGLCSGFVSSTATVAALGARVRHGDLPARQAAAGALASGLATWVQVQVLTTATAPALGLPLWPLSLVALLVLGGFVALLSGWRQPGPATTVPEPGPTDGPMLRPREAVAVAALLTVVTLGVGWARTHHGQTGLVLGAALSGLADAHAAVAALAAQVDSGGLTVDGALWAVLATVGANTVSRCGVALTAGGWAYGAWVSAGLFGSTAAAVVLAAVLHPHA